MGFKSLAFRTIKNNYLVKFPIDIPSYICEDVMRSDSNTDRLNSIQKFLVKKYTITGGSLRGQIFPYGENIMSKVEFMMNDSDLKLTFENTT